MLSKEQIDSMKLGDTVWFVEVKNTSFSRTKIRKVIDGEEWFKYSAPNPSVEVVEMSCAAITHAKTESVYPDDVKTRRSVVFEPMFSPGVHSDVFVEYTDRNDDTSKDTKALFMSEPEAEEFAASRIGRLDK